VEAKSLEVEGREKAVALCIFRAFSLLYYLTIALLQCLGSFCDIVSQNNITRFKR
jgi:hypothetical protein